MRAANLFAGLVFCTWAWLLWAGIGTIKDAAGEHYPGYVMAREIRFCTYTPATVLALLLLALIVFNYVTHSPRILAVSALVATLLVPAYTMAAPS
jgi:hypothetical protein